MKIVNWFNKITKREHGSSLVSKNLLPEYEEGGTNLEAKIMNKIALLAMIYSSFFKWNKYLLTFQDYGAYIGKPVEGWKKFGNEHMQDHEYWTQKDIEAWDKKISHIEAMMKVLEKSTQIKILDDCGINYQNDIHTHASFGGRWRFDSKEKKNKIVRNHGKKTN